LKVVKFTEAQSAWVDWAIGGMDDPEQYPENPPAGIAEADIHTLGFRLDVMEDMHWRLTEQAEDMWEDRDPDQIGHGASIQSARGAAEKLREAIEEHKDREVS
jgi:hypothetical protein